MPLPTLVARQYTTKGLLSLTNTDGLGYLGMKELEQKMRGGNRHVSMSLTRVVKDPGYLTQNDISSVKFAYILTVWQHMYIIHTYSIKKNVLNHKCSVFYGYYVQHFSGIFTFTPISKWKIQHVINSPIDSWIDHGCKRKLEVQKLIFRTKDMEQRPQMPTARVCIDSVFYY